MLLFSRKRPATSEQPGCSRAAGKTQRKARSQDAALHGQTSTGRADRPRDDDLKPESGTRRNRAEPSEGLRLGAGRRTGAGSGKGAGQEGGAAPHAGAGGSRTHPAVVDFVGSFDLDVQRRPHRGGGGGNDGGQARSRGGAVT